MDKEVSAKNIPSFSCVSNVPLPPYFEKKDNRSEHALSNWFTRLNKKRSFYQFLS